MTRFTIKLIIALTIGFYVGIIVMSEAIAAPRDSVQVDVRLIIAPPAQPEQLELEVLSSDGTSKIYYYAYDGECVGNADELTYEGNCYSSLP